MKVEREFSSEKANPLEKADLPPCSLLTQTAPMGQEIDCKLPSIYCYIVRLMENST